MCFRASYDDWPWRNPPAPKKPERPPIRVTISPHPKLTPEQKELVERALEPIGGPYD